MDNEFFQIERAKKERVGKGGAQSIRSPSHYLASLCQVRNWDGWKHEGEEKEEVRQRLARHGGKSLPPPHTLSTYTHCFTFYCLQWIRPIYIKRRRETPTLTPRLFSSRAENRARRSGREPFDSLSSRERKRRIFAQTLAERKRKKEGSKEETGLSRGTRTKRRVCEARGLCETRAKLCGEGEARGWVGPENGSNSWRKAISFLPERVLRDWNLINRWTTVGLVLPSFGAEIKALSLYDSFFLSSPLRRGGK